MGLYYESEKGRLWCGDCVDILKSIPDGSINCCVTSPPYYGLRDYGIDGQIGLEETPEEYVAKLVAVFREVWRVLRNDGTLWLNLGDSYVNYSQSGGGDPTIGVRNIGGGKQPKGKRVPGLKPKDLIGIPWLCAKALQQPFYSGRIKSEQDRVWLAATIDAEGSICGFHHTRKDDGSLRTGIHLAITNSNLLMLDNAYRIWPTSKQDHNNHGIGHFGKLDTYRWIAHNVDEKAALLQELYPYFICKKKQALLAWNFLELSKDAKRLGHSSEKDSIKEKRSWIVHSLSNLNHLESVDIPSWIKEPKSLYEQGYYLRQDIIWHKTNPMPESVKDRCTKSHEYLFLLTKSKKYYFDSEAVKEPAAQNRWGGHKAINTDNSKDQDNQFAGLTRECDMMPEFRNIRSVWTIPTQSYKGAHFATFPEKLIEPCIKAGCPEGGVVLDPFIGSGTVAKVAEKLNRKWIGIDLKPDYCGLVVKRINNGGNL